MTYPSTATAVSLEHSIYKYVSALDFLDREEKKLHFRVGRQMRCVLRGHKEATTGRVGTIAVKARESKAKGNKPRLDVTIVFVFGEDVRGPKPSVFLPESQQPNAPDFDKAEQTAIIDKAHEWIFANHVQKAQQRANQKAEMEALRAQRLHHTRGQAGQPPSDSGSTQQQSGPFPLVQFRNTLSEALQPLASSLSALTQLPRPAARPSSSPATGRDSAPSRSSTSAALSLPRALPDSPTALPFSLPAVSAAQAPLLAAALAHQLGNVHLAQQSYFLTAALAAAQMPLQSGHQLLLMPPAAPGMAAAPMQTETDTDAERRTQRETQRQEESKTERETEGEAEVAKSSPRKRRKKR